MCSRLPQFQPPANKVTETHKERAKDQLLAIQLLLSQRVSSSSFSSSSFLKTKK